MGILFLQNNDKGGMPSLRSWLDGAFESAADQPKPTSVERTRIYATSNIAYRASNKRGDAVSSVPQQILDSGGEPLPDTDPLVKGILRNYRENIKRSEITLCLWGYNLLAKRRSYSGNLYELRWINPNQYMRDIQFRGLRGFRVMAQRSGIPERYIKRENGVFQHEIDFDDDFGGVSPAQVAINEILTGIEMSLTKKSFMENRGVPNWVVGPAQDLPNKVPNEEDANRLMRLLQSLYKGSRNSGRTLVDRFRWQWTNLTMDWDKIKFTDQYADMYEAVSIAFDIPIALIRESASNYAQAEVARRDWGHSWLMRRCEWYGEVFTEQILHDPYIIKRYGTGLVCKPNFDDVMMLKEDDAQKVNKVNAQITGGYRDLYSAAVETGIDTPPIELKGYYMWAGVPTHISKLAQLTAQTQTAGTSTPEAVPTDGVPRPEKPPIPDPIMSPSHSVELPAQTGGKSVALMLSLANNPDLIGLQGMTKKYVGETPVEWNAPDTFHVTVATMPNATDEQVTALQSALDTLKVPDMTFKVGSLGTFDQLGSHAVHFKLRNNQALNDFQEQVYGLVSKMGIPTSGYSLPDQYTPHITMGYAQDKVPSRAFYSGLAVKPTELHMGVENDIVVKKPIGEDKKPTPPDDDPTPEPPPAKTTFLPDDVFSELKVAARKGAGFVPVKLPSATITYIKHLKEIGFETDVVLTAAKSFTVSVLARKAVSATQRDFEREFDNLMEAARADETTRRQASSKLRSLISTYVDIAFQDGLIDGGVDELAVTDEDKQALAKVKSDQSAFITSFLDELFKGDGITDNQAVYKATQWWGLSIYPAYLAGLESAAADNMFTWKLGKTEKHCESCLALDGQRHRFSAFKAAGWLPKGRKLICGAGGLCDCDIVADPGKEKGSLDLVPAASGARSFLHDHEHEEHNPELQPA